MDSQLILASSSPRRRQILLDLGVCFNSVGADIDESVHEGELAADYVQRLAQEKCQKIFQNSNKILPVLGSDTSVVVDGVIFSKPASEQDAVDMLMALSGRWHQVMTAVCVQSQTLRRQVLVVCDVEICPLTPQMCRAYWRTGEPQDKAGSYAIQGIGARLVKQIKGSHSAVVGLPVAETAQLLATFDISMQNFV